MSKALIIKNANFEENRVTTISFGEISCTGITFTSNTYTITDYDAVTVEYTLTPANTTDAVYWTSSDDTVVSVSGGTMTINGIGTATITATCGEYTATASITVSIAYTMNAVFGYFLISSGKTFPSYSGVTYSRIGLTGTGDQAADHGVAGSSLYPILIPQNTTSITVSRGESYGTYFYNGTGAQITWTSDVACGDTDYPNAATAVSSSDGYNLRSNQSFTVDVPDGADSFFLHFRTASTYTESDNPATLATTWGLTITFNTES